MKKKLLCVMMALAMTVALSSCSFARGLLGLYSFYTENSTEETTTQLPDESRPESQTSSVDSTYSDPPEDIGERDYHKISDQYQYKECRYGYNTLEEGHEQTLYEYIDHSVYNIESKKDKSGYYPLTLIQNDTSVNDVQFMKVLHAYEGDHPQVFWLSTHFEYFDIGSIRYFQLYSNVAADKCDKMQAQFYLAVQKIVSSIPVGATEYERELYLHDYIIKNCSYTDDQLWTRYSPYGSLVQHKAVCEGYSEAFQLLLNCAGIESTVAVGRSDGQAHAWNTAKIGDNWYYLDVTWDDSDMPEQDEFNLYYYFNVSGEYMKDNGHVLAPLYKNMTPEQISNEGGEFMEQFNLFLPDCTAVDANYFYKKAVTITDPKKLEKKVLDKLIETIKNKESYFYIRCGDKTDPDAVYHRLFDGGVYFEYITAANSSGRTGGVRVNNNEADTYTPSSDLIVAQSDYIS